jgi:AraC family transcriptional regulator of adaptative response/methylated-DNA-[protein]-cysteine methyltransferase
MPVRYTWTAYPSPIGSLVLAEADGQPLVVQFALRAGRMKWVERVRARRPGARIELGPCQSTAGILQMYFKGHPRSFPYPEYLRDHLDLTGAEEAVWRRLCDIPMGETRSYEDIAQATGFHARQVGQLVGANQLAILIPCHRVVGKRGGLVGYGGGLDRKRWLLNHELRTTGVVLE